MFSPGFFGVVGQALGQGGGRNVWDYKPFVIIAFVLIAAPLIKR